MKKYTTPIAKFHKLKSNQLMAGSLEVEDKTTPNAFAKSAGQATFFEEDDEE